MICARFDVAGTTVAVSKYLYPPCMVTLPVGVVSVTSAKPGLPGGIVKVAESTGNVLEILLAPDEAMAAGLPPTVS